MLSINYSYKCFSCAVRIFIDFKKYNDERGFLSTSNSPPPTFIFSCCRISMLRLDLKGEGGLCVGRTREEALQQIHSKEEKKKERWRSEPGSPPVT